MIAFVTGKVASVSIDAAVIDVGGLGFHVRVTPQTLADLHVGKESTVATSLVVREDSMTLYGFADDDERTVFEQLQSASGVGPRLAQAVLAVHSPDDLRRAIAAEDLGELTKVPGIGKKGAQRMVLELKDKLGAPAGIDPTGGTAPGDAAAPWRDQVRTGLVGLGWSVKDADSAVDAVAPLAEEGADVGELLRAALRTLAPR